MSDYLTAIANTTDTSRNTGNAVLYELARTIITIESNPSLKALSSTIIGRFLSNKDNNYKYVALNTLIEQSKNDLQSVQKHKNVILDCLKDEDITIQKRALDLVFIIVNSNNIKHITKDLVNYLITCCEPDVKSFLSNRLCFSLEKYSPSIKWQIDIMIKILCLVGCYVNDDVVSSVVNLIIQCPELHLYSVHKLFQFLKINMSEVKLYYI